MEAYIEVDLAVATSPASEISAAVRTGTPDEVAVHIQEIFFDGIEYPAVEVEFRDNTETGITVITAKVEIQNLAGDETIDDIRSYFEDLLAKAVEFGDIADWAVSALAVDGIKTYVEWSRATTM